ncbi:MAG TPA: LPXTG cell wall anchor domain-containing protein [Marmoricola sp.]|nr:LPXTG cell wall anchor domain-containing protein [Marmoricola sp.]
MSGPISGPVAGTVAGTAAGPAAAAAEAVPHATPVTETASQGTLPNTGAPEVLPTLLAALTLLAGGLALARVAARRRVGA